MAVSLKAVTFHSEWSEQVVLRDIQLHLSAGERICIGGASGSGKSTLLQLISGVLEPTSGRILIDGEPLGGLDLEHLRAQIGDCISQEDIFTGSVLDNITMGRSRVTDQELEKAIELTGLRKASAMLPQGLMTRLDPQGNRLPKSLVHRIILARCLAGRPRLVLFEDQLHLLDPDEREAVLDHLLSPNLAASVIAVSNDPHVQRRFQRTLVLREGQLQQA